VFVRQATKDRRVPVRKANIPVIYRLPSVKITCVTASLTTKRQSHHALVCILINLNDNVKGPVNKQRPISYTCTCNKEYDVEHGIDGNTRDYSIPYLMGTTIMTPQ
jgi:hypothetical protein